MKTYKDCSEHENHPLKGMDYVEASKKARRLAEGGNEMIRCDSCNEWRWPEDAKTLQEQMDEGLK